MQFTGRHLILALACASITSPAVAALRVDVGIANGRNDVLTPRMANLSVSEKDAGTEATQTFGDVTATVAATGDKPALAGAWWKAGLDTNATLASDAAVATGGAMELRLSGLAPGRHTLVTYHNAVAASDAIGTYTLAVKGGDATASVRPTRRVTTDVDAATAYLTFDATAGQDVVVTIRSDQPNAAVYLNGFAVDVPDPKLQARNPTPADHDEHAAEGAPLAWAAPQGAAAFDVYFGATADAVRSATRSSPQYKGKVTEPGYVPSGLNTHDSYYWRVDPIAAGGDAPMAAGEVWRFRVRHLAFPGAEGYGRFARGGRGGRVLFVTNLNDSGPGSLRAAVEAEGARTVIFRVGGTITLDEKLIVKNPYVTIAGQTAPGDGIAVRAATFGFGGTHDAVIRYVRVRVGDATGETHDGMGFGSSNQCVIDHCSISWTIDEGVSGRGARNITFSRNIIAEALNMSVHSHYVGTGKGHGYAGSISGEIGSFHHNLLAHNAGRNWSLAGGLTKGGRMAGYLDIRNNVVYNWEHRTNDGGVKALNLVGNYYIPGPATRVFHLLMPDTGAPGDPQQYYVAGNVMEGRPQYDRDNWANGGVISSSKLDPNISPQVRLDKPFAEPFVTTRSAREAYESIIKDVGANLPRWDAVDQRAINDTINRTATFKGSKTGLPGIIDSQTDVGGWPELKSGPAPADADNDGMPDAWEAAQNLNPNDPADGNAVAGKDAYTNLERYLQWIIDNNGKLAP